MGRTAEKTDPKLWEKVKAEVTGADKGGKPGQWSARKAQIAVQEYKKDGGGYDGAKSRDNGLQRWQDEDWGTKSGARSVDTGERYLPRKARESLSNQDYQRTSAKKRADTAKGRQLSRQPRDVAAATAKPRQDGHKPAPTRAELYELAKKRGIRGRSAMSKPELEHALS
jgi:hypothetical protein